MTVARLLTQKHFWFVLQFSSDLPIYNCAM